MKVSAIKIKLFGKTETMYRAIDANGEVVQVFESKEEAESWIANK
jgi:transposase-like protein